MEPVKLLEIFQRLPPGAQEKVLSFIGYLAKSHAPLSTENKTHRKLAEEPFVGMWSGRSDLEDSHAWVRRTREQEWNS